jgi:2-haloacid dehalogenase
LSGLPIGECARYVVRGKAPASPRDGFSAPLILRSAVDDAEGAAMQGIKVLAFDAGGTILDWHAGLVAALAECGARRGIKRDWHAFANEYRRRSLQRMLGAVEPAFNIDDVHRDVLDELLGEAAIDAFSPEDRHTVAQRWHELEAWPDFVPALARLRPRYVCVSFTILSLSLVVDVSRRNGMAGMR